MIRIAIPLGLTRLLRRLLLPLHACSRENLCHRKASYIVLQLVPLIINEFVLFYILFEGNFTLFYQLRVQFILGRIKTIDFFTFFESIMSEECLSNFFEKFTKLTEL